MIKDKLPIEKHFRLRGTDTTRVDTFIDAAFAFATTMLVISIGNIPKTISELLQAFSAIPSFLASFISVVFIWMGHRKWSRRYGIENGFTITLSFTMVFILLIYVYPLRLVFSSFFAYVSGGFFPSEFIIASGNELTELFIFYGLGFAAIAFCLGSLFVYSLHFNYNVELNTPEKILTKYDIASWFTMGGTALCSALFALIMPVNIGVFAGFVYTILPFLMPAISISYSKKLTLALKKQDVQNVT